jgi:hypothetical protein
METKIVVPSHKRHDKVLTNKAVANTIICVPESQYELYKLHNPETEIVTHSDSVVGLLPKRNWIYKNFGNVMMLDDDIDTMTRLYVSPKEEVKVKPATAYDIIQELAYACKDAGAFLFGFNTVPNPTMYKANEPIKITGYVTGCAQGLLAGSKLWYNEKIILNCDYWISLLNAYYHRYCFKDMRFYMNQKETFSGSGGLSEFRNLDAEEHDFKLLRKYFGEAVQFKKTNNKRHKWQKTIKLPF